jgi:hypothetical protein
MMLKSLVMLLMGSAIVCIVVVAANSMVYDDATVVDTGMGTSQIEDRISDTVDVKLSNGMRRRLYTYVHGVNVSTIAGQCGLSGGNADGTGTNAQFNAPGGLAIDATFATLYMTDNNNHKIKKLILSSGNVFSALFSE